MAEEQRSEGRKSLEPVFWRREPRVVMEVQAADRLVCRLPSVFCSLDIVKRVVTVKQVRPSPLGVRLDLEHGYA
jgi:hypothetical protein